MTTLLEYFEQETKPSVKLNQSIWHIAARNNAKPKVVTIKMLNGSTISYTGK